MDVYLDAVFHPKCITDKRTFEQEGWHYELDSPEVSRPGLGGAASEHVVFCGVEAAPQSGIVIAAAPQTEFQ